MHNYFQLTAMKPSPTPDKSGESYSVPGPLAWKPGESGLAALLPEPDPW